MKILNKFLKWVKQVFSLTKTDKQLEKAIGVVSKIKQYADSPITLIIVKATPI